MSCHYGGWETRTFWQDTRWERERQFAKGVVAQNYISCFNITVKLKFFGLCLLSLAKMPSSSLSSFLLLYISISSALWLKAKSFLYVRYNHNECVYWFLKFNKNVIWQSLPHIHTFSRTPHNLLFVGCADMKMPATVLKTRNIFDTFYATINIMRIWLKSFLYQVIDWILMKIFPKYFHWLPIMMRMIELRNLYSKSR